MPAEVRITPARPRSGVLVLTGYGLRVAVERGQLMVSDGRGRERRTGRFSRASRDLRRLVVIGHTGHITFEALRWLHDIGAAFVQIDADGTVIAASGPAGTQDARLRRAQAVALYTGDGIQIARDIQRRKLAGQADVVASLATVDDPADEATTAATFIRSLLAALDTAHDLETIVRIEADAASAYFAAWNGIGLRWAAKDEPFVPDHWRAFVSRLSPLSSGPTNAADPINALANYSYAILEAEARIALLAVGLDPCIGLLHTDRRGRDSFVFDAMEPVRPVLDRWMLDQVTRRTFQRRDFHETRTGGCRLGPSLAKLIAESVAPLAREQMAWEAERLARRIMDTAPDGTRVALPNPLTKANRATSGSRRAPVLPSLPRTCLNCGAVLPRSDRAYCDACIPDTHDTLSAAKLRLATLSAEGRDPRFSPTATQRRAASMSANRAAAAQWEREHDVPDRETFSRDLLPALQSIPVREMRAATGFSAAYCRSIRSGRQIPHPRHWPTFRTLIDDQERLS